MAAPDGRAVWLALRLGLPLAVAGGVALLWEAAPRLGWVRPTSVPPFTRVMAEIGVVLQDPRFGPNLVASAGRWALGLTIAVFVGTALGVLMGRSRAVERAIDPLLVMLYPVPKVAFVLLLILWFGTGNVTRVSIVALGSVVPLVVSAFHGAAGVEPRLLWAARSLGVGGVRLLARVVLPAALPQILSGGRIAISISIFTLLASELLIRESGVGAYLFNELDAGQFVTVWATGMILAAVGFLLDVLYVRVVRTALPWVEGEV